MSLTLRLTLLAAAVSAAAASCPSYEWKQYRHMCYWGQSNYTLHWDEVADVCNTVYSGAEMVTIHDEKLNTYIAAEIAVYDDGSLSQTWIGLARASSFSSWFWKDGSAVNYTQWYENDDDNVGGNCALTNYAERGMWAGWNCDASTRHFMCQIAAH